MSAEHEVETIARVVEEHAQSAVCDRCACGRTSTRHAEHVAEEVLDALQDQGFGVLHLSYLHDLDGAGVVELTLGRYSA